MPLTHLFVITEQDLQVRLDKLLFNHFPTHSRTYFQYLIDKGAVLVNGKPCKKREKPKRGDKIEVSFIPSTEISLTAENIPLDIIYEDEEIVCINKPAGMVVHPAVGHPNHTFVNALLFHCQQLKLLSPSMTSCDRDLRPGIVHRLDKETSGLLLAAKTLEMHAQLIELFTHRKIEKHYLAICIGNPGNVSIDAPLGRHPVHRKERAVLEEGGKKALSHITTLKTKNNLSLVDIHPVTGRTHQIRVHMKHHNTPILGDSVYGSTPSNQKYKVERQLLHAHTLTLTHPRTQCLLTLTAPLPIDFLKWINIFGVEYNNP